MEPYCQKFKSSLIWFISGLLKQLRPVIFYNCNQYSDCRQVITMAEKEPIWTSVRIRPFLGTEAKNDQNCIKIDNNHLSIAAQHQLKHYELPSVFPPEASQGEVFQALVQPLIEDMFTGYSCAFFCCGQNGSGKSYTLEGGDTPSTKGVISRLQEYISMKLQAEQESKQSIYLLRVSYIEICEQQITDLLDVRRGKQLKVVQKGRDIQLSGLELKHISNLQDLESFFIMGNRKRRYAYKKKIRSPQKSTSIFTLYLQSMQKDGINLAKKGKLHFVDMCASKNIPRSDIHEELIFKNNYDISTNALKNVVLALAYGGKHTKVPYNDSKVTLLLRQFFGGFGRTKILFHLYPGAKGLSATLDSIGIAKLLSMVQNYPHCHLDPTKVAITSLLQQLQQTRQAYLQISKTLNTLQQKVQEQPQLGEDNQFLTKSYIDQQNLDKIRTQIEGLQEDKLKLKKRIEGLGSLFLNQKSKDKEIDAEVKRKYLEMLERKSFYTAKGALRSLGSSADYFGGDISEPVGRIRDRNRIHKQEIFDLQKQFQEERQTLLDRIRQLQGEFKFYQSVSQQTIKKDEIDILRNNSHYDETTRSYQLPKFTVLHKKLSIADRTYSPHAKSFSQRTFYIGGRSLEQLKGSIGRRSGSNSGVRQIKSGAELQEEYFRREMKESKKESQCSKQSKLKSQGSNEYELNQGLRKKNGNSKKRTFKPFSKFKF